MRSLAAFLATATLIACSDPSNPSHDAAVDAAIDAPTDAATDAAADGGGLTTVAVLPANLNRDLDVLFVIDNSAAMAEEQVALGSSFPQFLNTLNQVAGGLPDVHVGVISTNVGSGGVNVGGCSSAARPNGDDGNLLTNGCTGLAGQFIADVKQPDGTRIRNYTGDLATLFSCMAQLGTTGCGFEQPLESLFRALSSGRNPGFLRASARLAVVIVSEEDDCSATPGGGLFGDPTGTVTSPLGPRTSFRCFEFGVECDNDPNPRSFGPRTGCAPRVGSTYVRDVAPYVDYLRSLKANPRDVIVAGIIGDVDEAGTATVVPDPDDATRPYLGPSCQSAAGTAVPAIRLQTFLDGFPARNHTATICNDNLSGALTEIAAQIYEVIGNPCVDEVLIDTEPQPGLQPRCEVTQYLDVNGVPTNPMPLPACGAGAPPCWRITSQPAVCASTPGGLGFEIDRGGNPAPLGTTVEFRCEVEP